MGEETVGKARHAIGRAGLTYLDLEEAMRISGYNTLRYTLGGLAVFLIGSYAFSGEIKEVTCTHI